MINIITIVSLRNPEMQADTLMKETEKILSVSRFKHGYIKHLRDLIVLNRASGKYCNKLNYHFITTNVVSFKVKHDYIIHLQDLIILINIGTIISLHNPEI